MDIAGIRFVFAPGFAAGALGFALAGIGLGTISGLTPGLHANNFALMLAAAAPSIPGPPTYVGVAMLAAGVTHTFLDVVPALALGVPDPAMAATALPGHRLVLEGRGHEALRLSALGSGLAVAFAVPLAIPVTAVMVQLYPVVRPRIAIVLTALVVFMIATESTTRARSGAALAFGLSVVLGIALLDRPTSGLLSSGDMLAPLFAGLFGAPVLVDAIGGAGVPKQAESPLLVTRRTVALTAAAGAIAGAVVGYLPGVSSAIAAVMVLAAFPAAEGARGFVIATSGINTSNTIFALFALVALGTPRTGILVAFNEAGVPLNLPLLLASVGIAAAAGFLLVPALGDRYLRVMRGVDYTKLSAGILVGLVGLSFLFAGSVGVGAFAASAALGLLPPRVGCRRVHLMGVLIGPIVVAT